MRRSFLEYRNFIFPHVMLHFAQFSSTFAHATLDADWGAGCLSTSLSFDIGDAKAAFSAARAPSRTSASPARRPALQSRQPQVRGKAIVVQSEKILGLDRNSGCISVDDHLGEPCLCCLPVVDLDLEMSDCCFFPRHSETLP